MALKMIDELFTDEKLTLEDVKRISGQTEFDFVSVKTRGSEPIYMTHSMCYAFLGDGIPFNEINAALKRFYGGDYGTYYHDGDKPEEGYEYGCYPSSYGSTPDTGAIMVHRFYNGIVVYLGFEDSGENC